MNVSKWKETLITNPLPILSYPSTSLIDCTVGEMVTSAETQAKGVLSVSKHCNMPALLMIMDLSVEAEAFGAPISISRDDPPTVTQAIASTPEDIDRLAVPSIGSGRTSAYINAVKIVKAYNDGRPILSGAIGPYTLAARLMGMNEIMFACMDTPEAVKTLLEKTTRFVTEYIGALKDAGADGVIVADPVTGLLPPYLATEFALPYMSEVIRALQSDSFAVIYHNCGGSVIKMADELAAMGADAYHFGDAIDLEEMCRLMPDSTVMGNISPYKHFHSGTPFEMRNAVKELVEKCGKYPNFVLSSGCDIPAKSPWQNIDAFFEAAKILETR